MSYYRIQSKLNDALFYYCPVTIVNDQNQSAVKTISVAVMMRDLFWLSLKYHYQRCLNAIGLIFQNKFSTVEEYGRKHTACLYASVPN